MKNLRILFLMLSCIFALTAISSTVNAADKPRVKISTNKGDIVVELEVEKAPLTVANFLKYVDSGYYSETIFHRVIDGFMIQGGGFSADFKRKTTHAPVKNEANNGLTNDRGTIAMARTMDPHSATAQFFINVKNNGFLNHKAPTPSGWGYCVFGKVVEGLEVVDAIRKIPTGGAGPFPSDVPRSSVVINKAERL